MKTSGPRTRNEIPGLLLAAHAGRESEVQALLADGADVNAADGYGITPLMAAAMNGSLALAQLLLAAGADRGARNKWGMTAQDIARWHGREVLAAVVGDEEQSHCGTERASETRRMG